MRASKGVASQPRFARAYRVGTKVCYTDATYFVNGRRVAGEAKYVGDWSKSIYNPASNVGSRGFAKAVRQGVVKQAQDYLQNFDRVVLRTNSKEFVNYYSQKFLEAGILSQVSFELVP